MRRSSHDAVAADSRRGHGASVMDRNRDPVAVALAAIKGFFVEPVECPGSRFDAVAGGWPPAAEAAPPFAPEGLVPAPGVRGLPPAAPSPEEARPPAQAVHAPAVESPVPVTPAPDGPHPDTRAPAPPQAPHEATSPHPRRPRPVIAVFGLAPGCGASTVAHALALELAARDPARVAAVRCETRRARGLLGPAWLSGTARSRSPVGRLAGIVADFPGSDVRPAGRLCLVVGADRAGLAEGAPHFAPLVLDEGSAAVGGVAAAVADRSIVVTTPLLEPALAAVAAECIARVGADPIAVVNRVPDADAAPAGQLARAGAAARSGWFGASRLADAVVLPESRLGARLALRGKDPRGELQRAIVRLADRCLA